MPDQMFESILSTEIEKCNKQTDWSMLPSIPLERVYYFLGRVDQTNMSVVCRKWSEGFGSPSVWDSFSFHLAGSERVTNSEIKFAGKYSNMFQHVEIICRNIIPEVTSISWIHLKTFLDILAGNSHLRSVKFQNLGSYFRKLDSTIYSDIFKSIINVLKSQHQLKRAEFHECFFEFLDGLQLLKSLTENSRYSLTYLVLRGFVSETSIEQLQDSTIDQLLFDLVDQKFSKLITLEIDYPFIFVSLFANQFAAKYALASGQMGALSKIILHFDGFKKSGFRNLTSTAWRILKEMRPDIQVEFYFIPGLRSQRKNEIFLLSDIPLTLQYYCSDRLYDSSMLKIDAFINHLLACNISEHLVSLYVAWMRPDNDLASIFIPFLLACPKLRSLRLFTIYPVCGLDVLLRFWLENLPESLKEVLISVSNVTNIKDLNRLVNLAEEYMPVLKATGLDVSLSFERGWR